MSESISNVQLSLRLKMIYDMMPKSEHIWDVGTDHAFLPIYCVQTGKCKSAVASDIRRKPLETAKRNIALNGCRDSIKTVLCAGIEDCDIESFDTIVIAGMGGFTVREILSDRLSKENYFPGNNFFILQPNTAEHEVRKFLWDSGFTIDDESAVRDGAHVYACMKCHFTNQITPYNEIECYTGKIMPKRLSENDRMYFEALRVKYSNVLSGLMSRREHDSASAERMRLCRCIVTELDRIISLAEK